MTHGGVIGQILATAARSRPFAFVGNDNAAISRVVVTAAQWFVRSFNDTCHLHGADDPTGHGIVPAVGD